jgi:glycosyltransferase involved in cell wall biosynthesis
VRVKVSIMRVSVFTPSHDPRFLEDCYRSLERQTFQDWEWIILLNGAATDWSAATHDDRVRVVRAPAGIRGVGAAKRLVCEQATGEILVELDHDDILAPSCLANVVAAFDASPEAVGVYSDFAQINEDGSPNHSRFNEAMGWQYTDVVIDGVTYLRCHAMAATVHNMGYIWYEPNHVRAFRRTSYEAVGGYDASREVLDDQELMMRLFLAGDFVHVPECLYLQRVHSANTQIDPATNAFIQQETVALYQKHIESMARAWSQRRGLAVISLVTPTPVYAHGDEGLERVAVDPLAPTIPYDESSVGLIKAVELLQRIPDRAALFNECFRVLVHGGLVCTETPSTDGRGAFQDPSHVAFYNENSFWYLTQSQLRSSIPTLDARFQVSRIRTYHPTAWHEQVQVPYVQANLMAVKDGPRLGGPLLS